MLLVTGGCGYVGSHCVIELLKTGQEVVVIDNLSNSSLSVVDRIKKISNKEINFIKADIRDRSVLSSIFKKFNIDAVFHFAGLKSIIDSIENPLDYYSINVDGTCSILEEMSKNSVKKIIFSSSATVYGNNHPLPWKEDINLTMPSAPYSQTKFLIENLLLYFSQSNIKLDVAVLRYFNPIGSHKSGLIGENLLKSSNLIPSIINTINGKNKNLNIYGNDYDTKDGTGVRDFIHISDLIDGHLKAYNYLDQKGGYNIWNLGSGVGYSVLEVVRKFEEKTGQTIPINYQSRRKGDLSKYWADTNKADIQLNWKANRNLDEMVADTLNYINKS